MKINIREMNANDTKAVNSLSKQLGYPLSIEQILQNIQTGLQSNGHTAFVAECEKSDRWLDPGPPKPSSSN